MNFNCKPEMIAKLFSALLFVIVGLGSVALGVTSEPFLALLVALPLFALAAYYLRDYLSKSCEISR